LITSSWDKTAKLWNVATGEEIRTLDGHAEQVYTVAFSPKGKRVASGCNDGTIKIWDAATGKETATLSGHKGVVHSIAFGAKEKMIASVGWDKTVRLWNAKKGIEIAVLIGHTVPVMGVAFSADGTMLASVRAVKAMAISRPMAVETRRSPQCETNNKQLLTICYWFARIVFS